MLCSLIISSSLILVLFYNIFTRSVPICIKKILYLPFRHCNVQVRCELFQCSSKAYALLSFIIATVPLPGPCKSPSFPYPQDLIGCIFLFNIILQKLMHIYNSVLCRLIFPGDKEQQWQQFIALHLQERSRVRIHQWLLWSSVVQHGSLCSIALHWG